MARAGVKDFGGLIPIEDYDEFKKNFPQYGSTQWLLIEAVRSVNKLVRDRPEMTNMIAYAIEQSLRVRYNERTTDGAGQTAGQHSAGIIQQVPDAVRPVDEAAHETDGSAESGASIR